MFNPASATSVKLCITLCTQQWLLCVSNAMREHTSILHNTKVVHSIGWLQNTPYTKLYPRLPVNIKD